MLLNCLSVSLVYFSMHLDEDEALLQKVVRRFGRGSLLDLRDARVWCLHSSSPPCSLYQTCPPRAGPLLTGRTCGPPGVTNSSFSLRQQYSRTVYSAIPSVSAASLCVNVLGRIARDAR